MKFSRKCEKAGFQAAQIQAMEDVGLSGLGKM